MMEDIDEILHIIIEGMISGKRDQKRFRTSYIFI